MERALLPLGVLCGIAFWTLLLTGNETSMFGSLAFLLVVLGLVVREKRQDA